MLFRGVDELRQEQILCDTTVVCADGKLLAAHACILAAASPVLKMQLKQTGPGSFVVNLDHIPGTVCYVLMQFIYSGRLNGGYMAAMVGDILKASHMLQMVELMKVCEGFQRQTAESYERKATGELVAQQQEEQCKENMQETVAVSRVASVAETAAVSHLACVAASTATLSPPVLERQNDSKDVPPPPAKQSDTVSAVIDRLMQFDESPGSGQGFGTGESPGSAQGFGTGESPGGRQGFGGVENPRNIPVFPSASPVDEDAVAKAATQAVAYMASNPVTNVHQQEFPQNSDTATTGDSKDAAKMAQQNATAAVGTYG